MPESSMDYVAKFTEVKQATGQACLRHNSEHVNLVISRTGRLQTGYSGF